MKVRQRMQFGKDFFRIFNFAIAIIRLFVGIFGDDEAKKEVADSKARSKDGDADHAC